MGNITASLSRRNYVQHHESEEDREFAGLEKLKKKVIRKPRVDLVFNLYMVLERSIEEKREKFIQAFIDPVFIRNIIFELPLGHVESFKDLFRLMIKRSGDDNDKLSDLVRDVLSLHPVPLPDDAYRRLWDLKLSNTTIYLLNNYTRSNLQVHEENLNVIKIVSELSKQEIMDDVQLGRFRVFVSTNNDKIRNEFESILNNTTLTQLTMVLEKMDSIDHIIIRKIANHFNMQVEGYDIMYNDLRRTPQFIRSFISSALVAQWVECFRLFLEGENKNELTNALLSCKPAYVPIANHMIQQLEN